MPDTDDYSFAFQHWDHDLTNIEENLVVRAVYTITYKNASPSFDRTALMAMIRGMHGEEVLTDEEVNGEINQIMSVLGIYSEEHLFNLLAFVMPKIGELQTIDTPEAFNAWVIALTSDPNFDDEFIIDTLMHAIQVMLTNNVLYFDLTYLYDNIADYQGQIDNNIMLMGQIDTNAVNYCTVHTGENSGVCLTYYDKLKYGLSFKTAYEQAYNMYFWEGDHDSFKYDQLINIMEQYYYYTYVLVDPISAAMYMSDFSDYLDSLSPEEQADYAALIQLYNDWQLYQFEDQAEARSALDGIYDDGMQPVANHVETFFYDYQYLFFQNKNLYGNISNTEWDIQQQQNQHRTMSIFLGYLNTTEGYAKIRELLSDIYYTAKGLLTDVDPEIFALVHQIIGMSNSLSEGEKLDLSFLATPEKISIMIPKLAGLVTYIYDAFDPTTGTISLDNIISLGEDILTLAINNQEDLDATQKAAILAVMLPKVTEYANMALQTLGNLSTFLNSFDETKIQDTLDAVNYLMSLMPKDESDSSDPYVTMVSAPINYIGLVWAVANIIDVTLGDDSLDVDQLFGNIMDVYFDIRYKFQPDEDTKTDVKAAILANNARLIELAGIIASYDPLTIGVDGVAAIDEFMARAQAFVGVFQYGPEAILEPIVFGYEHEDFVNLVYMIGDYGMTEAEAEQMIVDIMAIMGQTDEETAYNILQALMMHVMNFRYVQTFTDLKTWYNGFYNLGYTRDEVANILIEVVKYKLGKDVAEGGYYDEEEAYYNNQIDMYEGMLIDYQGNINDVDAVVSGYLSSLDQTLIDNYMAYWAIAKEKEFRGIDMEYLENQYYYSDNNEFDYWTYQNLLSDFNDLFASYSQTVYDDWFASLDSHTQEVYGELFAGWNEYVLWYIGTFEPADDAMDFTLYDATGINSDYESFINQVRSYYYDMKNVENWISGYQNDLDRLAVDRTRSEMFLAYLNVPEKAALLQGTMLVASDEVDNLLETANETTFNMFFQILRQKLVGGLKIMVEPALPPESGMPGIDLSPEAVTGYVHDFAALLGALFQTIDETEMDNIKTLLHDVALIQFTAEGVVDPELTAMLDVIDLAADRYLTRIPEVTANLASVLAGLTIDDVTRVMGVVNMLPGQEISIVQGVFGVSILIDVFVYDDTPEIPGDTLDITMLIPYGLQLYYDVTTMFATDPTVVDPIASVFISHAEDLVAQAHTIAGFDPTSLSSADLDAIFALYKYVMWIGQYIQDPSTLVYPVPEDITFTYEHQDFVNLIIQMYGDYLSPEEIEAEIQTIMDVFETTDELTAFYSLMQLGSMFWALNNLNSFNDFLNFYNQIAVTTFTNTELASYMVNILKLQLDRWTADSWDYQYLTIDGPGYIQEYEDDITYYEGEMAAVDDEFTYEVGLLALNPTYAAAAPIATEMYGLAKQAEIAFYGWSNAESQAYGMEDFYFDYMTYHQLVLYKIGGAYYGDEFTGPDPVAYDNLFYSLSLKEQEVYGAIVLWAEQYWNAEVAYMAKWEELNPYGAINSYTEDFGNYIQNLRFQWSDAYWGKADNERWLQEENAYMAGIADRIKIKLTMQLFLSDPENVTLFKQVLASMMDTLDTTLAGLTEEQIANLDEIFWKGPLSDVMTTPEEAVMRVQALMLIFGPIFSDATVVDSPLNTLLQKLTYCYAQVSPIPTEGMTVEEYQAYVETTLMNFISQMYLVDGFDLMSPLTPSQIEEINLLGDYIQDFKTLLPHQESYIS